MDEGIPPSPIAILEEYIQRPNYDRSESNISIETDSREYDRRRSSNVTYTGSVYRSLTHSESQLSLRAPSIMFKDLQEPETTTAITLSNVVTSGNEFGASQTAVIDSNSKSSKSNTPVLEVMNDIEDGGEGLSSTFSNGRSISENQEEDVSKILGHILNDKNSSINRSVSASIFSGATGFAFSHFNSNNTNAYNESEFSSHKEGQISMEDTPIDYGFQIEKADDDNSEEKFFKNKKHFFILSSAGKPIYSMHGADDILTVYSGVIQTIISFFQFGEDGESELLKSFVAGNVKFLFLNQSPIILMAASTLNESDIELNQQLDFLYNFFLTTLSKPHIEKVFQRRENFDLRKLLGRADIACLDSICNSLANFNNPGLIIGGLECLKLRNSVRTEIERIMLSKKSDDLLYGLLVAPGARLITVLRPRKHTLHTSDLQQLFSMVFNTNTFKSSNDNDQSIEQQYAQSNEEFWVPICLPKFNPNGFLYSFIQFFDLKNIEKMEEFGLNQGILNDINDNNNNNNNNNDNNNNNKTNFNSKIAVILISAYKDSFFAMRDIGTSIIKEVTSNRTIYRELYKSIVGTQGKDGSTGKPSGRISPVDIQAPLIKHFIFKSNRHTQYVFSRLQGNHHDDVEDEIVKGQLMMVYSYLHSKMITNTLNNRIPIIYDDDDDEGNNHNMNSSKFISYIKWKVNNKKDSIVGVLISTPAYEVYAINNGGIVDKDTLVKSCKNIIKWCKKNEDKLFVSGGAVF